MRFGQAIMSGYRNYAVFSGRAGIDEYWHLARFTQGASLVLGALLVYFVFRSQALWMQGMAGLSSGKSTSVAQPSLASSMIAGALALMVVTLPLWSCAVRRLHDTGRAGWHYALPPAMALAILAALYVTFVPAGVSPVQAFSVLFTPIWFYEPRLLIGLVAFALIAIWLRTSLHRKLREPSQPGPNRYGPPPSEVTP